jgi:sugar lactone lactonase YvrE
MTSSKENSMYRFRPATLFAGILASCLVIACHNNNSNNSAKGLWIANANNVIEYIPSQLAGGTSAAVPHRAINSTAIGAPQGVTFDAAGNLWVLDPEANVNGAKTPALLKYTPAELNRLGVNGSPDPVAIFTSTALAFPQQSIFDAKGNQWVSDHNNNTILVFSAAQLMATGTSATVPVVVISSTAFNGPLGIVLDKAGNLWVANNGGVPGANNTMSAAGTTIVEFKAANLPMIPSSGMLTPALTPDVTLSDNGADSIQSPWELAFDAAGNLWSSNSGGTFSLVAFSAAMQMATGAPTPTITINSTKVGDLPTLDATNGLCFDPAGNVAATNSADAFGVSFYTKAQLTTGAPTPNTFIVGGATGQGALAGCNFGTLAN